MNKVDKIRISLGTAIQLGLEKGLLDPNFTSAFIMTYSEDGCVANCAFCPQSRESVSSDHLLSRIGWPMFSFTSVIEKIKNNTGFSRYCIQTLNYPNLVDDAVFILSELRKYVSSPISICIHPISTEEMSRIHAAGATDIGIAFDACTPQIFSKVKGSDRMGPYRWESHYDALDRARSIFGKDNVTTHLIVGLGEAEGDAAEFLIHMYEMGYRVGLFAFTNIRGTALENEDRPALSYYRRIQVLRHLLSLGILSRNEVSFDNNDRIVFHVGSEILREALSSGRAFQVTGCPGCNRPYYNERPSGPMYNFPRPLTPTEIERAIQESELVI